MLTPLQKAKLANLFAMYDANHDGVIRREDFVQVFNAMMSSRNWTSDSEQYKKMQPQFMSRWDQMRKFADTNKDDEVTLDEYLAYWDDAGQRGAFEQAARGITELAFQTIDANGDGMISMAELKSFQSTHGLDAGNAGAVYAKMGWPESHMMSKDEHLGLVRDFFESQDPQAAGNLFFGPVNSM